MAYYVLTLEQVNQLESLNRNNICFCATGHPERDFIVGDRDLDAPEFAEHKALLDSFGIELVEDAS